MNVSPPPPLGGMPSAPYRKPRFGAKIVPAGWKPPPDLGTSQGTVKVCRASSCSGTTSQPNVRWSSIHSLKTLRFVPPGTSSLPFQTFGKPSRLMRNTRASGCSFISWKSLLLVFGFAMINHSRTRLPVSWRFTASYMKVGTPSASSNTHR